MMQLALALVVLCASTAAHAAVFSGSASSQSGFAYLGKFCFRQSPDNATSAGTMTFEFSNAPSPQQDLYIALYDDQESSWYSVYKKGLTCAQSLPFARNYASLADLTVVWDVPMGPYPVTEVTRPRFWWVALINCYGQGDAQAFSDVKYHIHFEQNGVGSWTREFGYNEYGLNSQYLAVFFFFFALCVAQAYSIKQMWSGRVHPIVKLFSASLGLEFWSVLFYLAHYGKFTTDGVGATGAAALGEVLDAAARITLIITLILLAQGWTIARDEVLHKWFVLGAAVVLSIAYFAFIIWDLTGRDTTVTLYVYDGAAGYFICALITLCAFWFAAYAARSYAHENDPEKAKLFVRMGVLFFLWFLSLPLIVLIALGVDPWDREKVVSGLLISVSLFAYTTLTFGLWHSRAARFFKISTPDLHTAMRDENL